MIIEKTITEFLSNEYKEFALYSIEGRAIPSVIDGFKPTQRKIIHIASIVWKTGTEKTLKVFQLSGKVASDAFYHHGDMSLSNAIINLAQKFKNNAPLLHVVWKIIGVDGEAQLATIFFIVSMFLIGLLLRKARLENLIFIYFR